MFETVKESIRFGILAVHKGETLNIVIEHRMRSLRASHSISRRRPVARVLVAPVHAFLYALTAAP